MMLYRGKDVRTLTKAELVAAVEELGQLLVHSHLDQLHGQSILSEL